MVSGLVLVDMIIWLLKIQLFSQTSCDLKQQQEFVGKLLQEVNQVSLNLYEYVNHYKYISTCCVHVNHCSLFMTCCMRFLIVASGM